MDKILRPWRHYVDFSGRSTRTEFWLFFIIFYGVIAATFVVTDVVLGGTALQDSADSDEFSLIYIPVVLICPLLSGPEAMIVWTTKGTLNAEQEAQAGRDYRQAT